MTKFRIVIPVAIIPRFKSITPGANLSDQVSEVLRNEIRAGSLSPGDRLPTEAAQTRCVIHTHTTHCVALSLQSAGSASTPSQSAAISAHQELLPPITPYFVMKVGHVPRIAYHRPGDPKTAELVAQAITRYGRQGTPIRAVMLERLGPNVWHDTPAAAMATLEELEETARLWHTSQPKPEALSDDQINELRAVFGARW